MLYKLPQGTGYKKVSKKSKKLSPLQQDVMNLMNDPVNGPLFFAEHCCYVKRNGLVNYCPFDYQREMLFNMHNYQNVISLWSRQNGKTTTSAIYILWYAMVYPYKDIIITSYNEQSANEILTTIKLLYENCPNFLKRGCLKMNESIIHFDNGSRICSRATTTKAARGLSPAIIYCDEFAFVGNADAADKALVKQEEFFAAVSPALSTSHGKLLITSTPISETDLFYRLWSGAIKKTNDSGLDFKKQYIISLNGELYRDFNLFNTYEDAQKYTETLMGKYEKIEIVTKEPAGNNGFVSQLVKWDACPLKNEEWKESELKKVGVERFEREYNCLGGENTVQIMDEKGNIKTISLEILYNYY